MDRFHGNGHLLCIFCFWKLAYSKQAWHEVPYNKLLTNLTSSCCTGMGNIGPRSFCMVRLVRTATTSGQYSPVQPSRSVNKRVVFREETSSALAGFHVDDFLS